MTKQDKIGATLRKLDYLWNKRGMTFCKALKEILGDDLIIKQEDITDDDIIEKIKDIHPNEKDNKE